jgi:hypothetical protein
MNVMIFTTSSSHRLLPEQLYFRHWDYDFAASAGQAHDPRCDPRRALVDTSSSSPGASTIWWIELSAEPPAGILGPTCWTIISTISVNVRKVKAKYVKEIERYNARLRVQRTRGAGVLCRGLAQIPRVDSLYKKSPRRNPTVRRT